MPSRFKAFGPAPATSPSMAAAHPNALNRLIVVKSGAGIDVAAHAAGIAIRRPGRNRQAAVSGIAYVSTSAANRIPFPGETRKSLHELFERTTEGIKEELIASRTAQRTRDQHAPEIKMPERHADARGDKHHLAFNGGCDEDAGVEEGRRRHGSTSRRRRAAGADAAFDGAPDRVGDVVDLAFGQRRVHRYLDRFGCALGMWRRRGR